MADGLSVPIIAGLAVGIAIIILFSLTFKTASVPTSPTLPQKQAIDIAAQDLTTKYIKNPENIKIYTIIGHGDAAYIPAENFTKQNWILHPLVYVSTDGAFYIINATTHVATKCHSPYCPLPEKAMKTIEGRLAWVVDLASACKNYPEHATYLQYAIDAENGEILWRGGDPLPAQAHICS